MSGNLVLIALLILFLTLAASLWFTYIISQRTIKPIVQLTDSVKYFKSIQKNIALPYRQSQDEIGYLARTIDSSFTQLNDALKREADFTRDVGHELRTPLTIINNTLALNHDRPLAQHERTCLQQQTNNLKNTIDMLMSLARAESVYSQKLNLRAHIEECTLAMYSALKSKSFQYF